MNKTYKPLSPAYYLSALTLLIVAGPFTEPHSCAQLFEAMALTVVLLFAVLTTGASRKTMFFIAIPAALTLVNRWLYYSNPDFMISIFYLVPGIFTAGITAFCLLRYLFLTSRVDFKILCAGIATYLTLALLWSLAYNLTEKIAPGSFFFMGKPMSESLQSMSGFTALYFSFATLCTVGYGAIVPVSGAARLLAVLEAVVGIFYVAIVIARLVALYSNQLDKESKEKSYE